MPLLKYFAVNSGNFWGFDGSRKTYCVCQIISPQYPHDLKNSYDLQEGEGLLLLLSCLFLFGDALSNATCLVVFLHRPVGWFWAGGFFFSASGPHRPQFRHISICPRPKMSPGGPFQTAGVRPNPSNPPAYGPVMITILFAKYYQTIRNSYQKLVKGENKNI